MSQKWMGWGFIIFMVILAIWLGPRIQEKILEVDVPIAKIKQTEDSTMIIRAVDGDTVEIADNKTVRYIGIDTPETKDRRKEVECFGREAYEHNKSLVEGKTVTLERDVSDKDKYGRLLRYVWIGDRLINEELVKQGFASVATYPPDVKYYQRLLAAQIYAKDNQLGLWKKCK